MLRKGFHFLYRLAYYIKGVIGFLTWYAHRATNQFSKNGDLQCLDFIRFCL